MKGLKRPDLPSDAGRRRLLSLLPGLCAIGLTLPVLTRRQRPKDLDLREADFYRPHDLAG